MLKLTRQIADDERGSAVVEFAFLLPILLMLFVGVVELTSLLRLERKAVAAAQTTADLVTQRREVNNALLDDILRAAELIFEPYEASSITVGIAAVRYDEDSGDPEIDWTKSRNGGSVPDALTVVEDLGEPGEGVIVVRVTYDYAPVFFDFVVSPMVIEETAVLRPRRSRFVLGPTS